TKVQFDPRLKNARPPSFPLTDRYELESWDGEWRVDDESSPARANARDDPQEEQAADAPAAVAPADDAPATTDLAGGLSASSSR
ncbi:MAG TPA: hypothetical protein VMV37_11185, partial [Gammaproteobacteria bacterium]|nr:hypothetical protein [Gammaproteobacteria bacterium]